MKYILIAIVIFVLVVLFSALRMSSILSREEEKNNAETLGE